MIDRPIVLPLRGVRVDNLGELPSLNFRNLLELIGEDTQIEYFYSRLPLHPAGLTLAQRI